MMTYDHFRFDGSKFGVIRRMPPFCDRIKGHDFGGVKQLNCQSCIWHVSPIHINTSQYLNIPQYCKRETRLPVSFDLVWPKLLPSYLPRWSLPWQSSTNTALPWQARCLPWQPWWLRPRKLPRCAPWSLQFLRSLRRQPRWIRRAWTWFGAPGCCEAWSRYGYGSIPINAIFRGMNIHKSQLFWCEQKGYKVLTHCHIFPTFGWHVIAYTCLYFIYWFIYLHVWFFLAWSKKSSSCGRRNSFRFKISLADIPNLIHCWMTQYERGWSRWRRI